MFGQRTLPMWDLALYGRPHGRMTPPEGTAVKALPGYFTGRAQLAPPRETVLALETLAKRAQNRLKPDGMKWEADCRERKVPQRGIHTWHNKCHVITCLVGRVSLLLRGVLNGCGWSRPYHFRPDKSRNGVILHYSCGLLLACESKVKVPSSGCGLHMIPSKVS